ncbi:MAG TPA: protein kinase [Gemmatimonadaceae bacterium]|nr:protein kinase [Gemmatimonadaceae bacterium]
MNCTHCHTPLPDEARFCFSCGSDLSDGGVKTVVRPRDVTGELHSRLTHVLAGKYTVKKLLGAGGMGAVFLADDLTLEREVAIKVLPPDMSRDERVVARFQQEAKTAAKLDHPNIIPIHRVESDGGLHYFVMKYVTGRSLESMLEGGQPLPVPFVIRILSEAAAALGHAHARGVVHRDVKPANIMLGADHQVVLTDFGISKVGDLTSQLTQTGMIIGTPYYMSPEQATGRAVDGRSDQYSLAVLGHQLLTGKLLFSGDSAHTIIYRHVSEQPARVASLRPEVPAAVDEALDRALRKEPDERFATMEDFARALRSEMLAATAPLTPPTRATNAATVRMAKPLARKKASRRPLVLATGVVLAVAGVLGARTIIDRLGTATRVSSPAVESSAPPTEQRVAPAPANADSAPPSVTSNVPIDTAPPEPVITSPRTRPRPIAERVKRRVEAARNDVGRTQATPQVAPLTVASEPYGTLFVDGVEVGDTPIANYQVPIGRRIELRVERDGYKTRRESIMVNGPNAIRRRYILEAGEQP